MKILFACIAVVSSVFVGYGIGRRYVVREKLLSALQEFLLLLKNNISYRKDTLEGVFDNFIDKQKGEVKTFFKRLKALTYKDSETEARLPAYLDKYEVEPIFNFFKSLGQGNEQVESNNIDGLRVLIDSKLKEAREIREKKQPLAVKLSVAIGAVIAILLV